LGNVGSMLACRAGASDVPIIAEAALTRCSICRTTRPGRGCSPMGCQTRRCGSICMMLRPRRPDAGRLIEISRNRFGRPRAEIEQRISRSLAA
jgi:hypothetical protein